MAAREDARVSVELAGDLRLQLAEVTPLSELGITADDLSRVQPLLVQLAGAVAQLLGTDLAAVWTTVPGASELLPTAWVGFPDDYIAPLRVPYGTGSAGRAVQERTTVLVEDVETSPHYGAFRAGALAHGVRSVLSVPMLTLGGEAVGCLSTYYRSPVAPEPRDLELAAVYSAQAAEIVERARVHAEARALAARERRRSEQLHALAGAALSLSAADSLDEVLQLVTEAAVAVIGCHQGVTSRLPDGWANASTYVSLSERYASWRDYDRVPRGLGVLNAVTRENRPLRLTPDQLAAHPEWRGLRDAPDHPPLPDYLAAPLVGRDGRNLGLVQLSHKVDETAFTAEDEAILVQLAQLASGTVERLEALEAERSARAEAEAAAEALQRSLLPAALEPPVGLTAAARYLPGAAGTRVGGDWYDLLQVGDVVVLVVGDVMGRGVPAAALMGQLRATTRAYALEGHGPAEVLRRLDDVVLSLTGLHFTTCVVAVLDPVARTLRAASAGHLPPVLVTRDGTARLLPLDPCLPLGVGGGAFVETCAELQPGTLVLLYTDGLVESREASLEEGTARLLAAASGPVASAEATCDAVLAALGAAEGDDDTALLAVRLDPAVDGAEPLSLALPSTGASAATARAALREVLSGSQVDSDVAQLLVSELVTNAVRHAGGDGVLVRATLQADLLRVEVHDSSPSVPGPVSPAPESAEGGRGLLLVDALADRWGVEQVTAGKRTWFELGPER